MVTEKELIEFAKIIDECRGFATKLKVTTEISLNYIFTVLYSKALLTMCEIYTLLIAEYPKGYPEGAMALARNTYETMIIMTYLYDKKEDQELVGRFYDDYSVRTCYDHIKYLKWINAIGKGNEDTYKRLQELKDEYNTLLEKYADFTSGKDNSRYFRQYWWAGKGVTFNQLRVKTNFQYNYYYDISCYRVHAGMTGMITFDNTEEGLLIGNCEGGKEMPLFFSLLNFAVCTKFFCDIQHIECSEVFLRMDTLLKNI
jgi:hypothetical protein